MDLREAALAALRVFGERESVRVARRQQAIRDAHDAGATPTEIAAALGVKNRQAVYAALAADPAEPVSVSPAPAVLVRGPGLPSSTWAQLEVEIARRGWWMVRDRSQAWHLCRGRLPVVQVDLSTDPVLVGRTKARVDDDGKHVLAWAQEPLSAPSVDPGYLPLVIIQSLNERP